MLSTPRLLTSEKALKARQTVRWFCTAIRPNYDGEIGQDFEEEQLDVVVDLDSTPSKPKIQAEIRAKLGPDWQLADFWLPETDDVF
jgi:hypothetical protein